MVLRPYRQQLSLSLWDAPPKAEQTTAAWGSTSHSPAHEPSGAPHGLATKFKRSWLLAPRSEHSRWPLPPLPQIQAPTTQPTHLLSSLSRTSSSLVYIWLMLNRPIWSSQGSPLFHPKQIEPHPSLFSGPESLVSPTASHSLKQVL